ncbi:MAG: hypothetical protein ABL893_16690, partial [Hyphomicrobium sp.]
LEEGEGVAQNLVRALMWYTLAERAYAISSPQNCTLAKSSARSLSQRMPPLQIREAQIRADKWESSKLGAVNAPPASTRH